MRQLPTTPRIPTKPALSHRRFLALLCLTPLLSAAASPTNLPDPSYGNSTFGPGTAAVSLNTNTPYGLINPTGVGALIDTSYTLADLDPITGSLIGHDITTTATDAYLLTTDIATSTYSAIDTAELARTSLEQAERARQAEAEKKTGNHDIGPDGCPTSAPGNTLRNGAVNIGVAKLCENSVAQAPNAYAAMAIKYQLNHLGATYSQPKRMQKNHYDCSSLAMRSYDAAGLKILVNGWAPSTSQIRASSWATRISKDQTKPGDLVFPFPGHVSTKLSDGYMVHTARPGDVSHVARGYTNPYYNVRVNVDKIAKH